VQKLKLKEASHVRPRCPHCKTDISEVSYNELQGGMFGKRYIYFCSACRNTLGVSHRKGFWMG
jgi:uncharacterized protein with PIN domain